MAKYYYMCEIRVIQHIKEEAELEAMIKVLEKDVCCLQLEKEVREKACKLKKREG